MKGILAGSHTAHQNAEIKTSSRYLGRVTLPSSKIEPWIPSDSLKIAVRVREVAAVAASRAGMDGLESTRSGALRLCHDGLDLCPAFHVLSASNPIEAGAFRWVVGFS
jgi:hypothetical protein